MTTVNLDRESRGFCTRILEDLVSSGWKISKIPSNAKVPRNQLLLRLKTSGTSISVRILIYKVTTSGRNKSHERRVEITSTYSGKLKEMPDCLDVVLGYDAASKRYVGIDSSRLHIGGSTHNASSFFDKSGLNSKPGVLTISPHSANSSIFASGIEYHAFFDRQRISDYLFNHVRIHKGQHVLSTSDSRRPSRVNTLPLKFDRDATVGQYFELELNKTLVEKLVREEDVVAYENRDFSNRKRRKISPEELRRIQDTCLAVGLLGEQLVLERERERLHALKKDHAAGNVLHVSLTSVSEGFDIVSFEDDGRTKKFIEVKTTVGSSDFIDISAGEWRAAQRLGSQYYIARIKNIKRKPSITYYRNPFQTALDRAIQKIGSGWKIDLSQFD